MPAKHWMICAGKVTITTFRLFMRLFCLTMKMQQDDIFQQNMESQEDYEKAVGQLQNLKEVYEELIAYEVITSKEDIARYGVIGWDAGRIILLPVPAAI